MDMEESAEHTAQDAREGCAAGACEQGVADEPTAVQGRAVAQQGADEADAAQEACEGPQEEPPARDYEAERAKKLAYRASLSDEDIARMRKPAGYAFGCKVAEGVEGASPSGDMEERKRSAEQIERDMRIQQAARVDDWQARLDGMDSEARVQATLDCLGRRPSFARVLRAVLEHCRQERESGEVESYIETLPDFAANRQSARRYVFFLMRTGALSEVGYDADGNPVDERAVSEVQGELSPAPAAGADAPAGQAEQDGGEGADEAPAASDEPAAAQAEPACACGEGPDDARPGARMAADAPAGQADAAAACEQDAPAMGAPACDDPAAPAETPALLDPAAPQDPAPAEPVDPADLIVEWRITTTPEGLQALEATDTHGRLRTLLADQVQDRYAAYLDVLTFCEEPRTLAEISEFLIGNPGLEIDDRGIVNMQPNAYIGKLDKVGALVWTGKGWQTTKEAIEVLQEC